MQIKGQMKTCILLFSLFSITIGGLGLIKWQDSSLDPEIIYVSGAEVDPEDVFNILYLYQNDNEPRTEQALTLDPHFNITKYRGATYLESLNLIQYDCIVAEDLPLNNSQNIALRSYVNNGGSMIILMGDDLHKQPSMLYNLSLIEGISDYDTNDGVFVRNNEVTNPLIQEIEWNSIPECKNISIVSPTAQMETLIETQYEDDSRHPAVLQNSNGTVILMTIILDSEFDQNKQFKHSFYYNYIFYVSMMTVIDDAPEPLPYKDWAYSPIPHTSEKIWIGLIELTLITVAVCSFLYMRKKSRTIPQEEYIEFYKNKLLIIEEERKKKQDEEEILKAKQKMDDWEEIGTHRQFSGFLFGLFSSIFLMMPQLILTGFVFSRYIMPYPFIAGMYDNTKQLFTAIWVLFDLGTSIALAKFFAQYRVKQPERAIRYIQIFIWFQVLTGVIQTALIGFLGAFYFPETHLASMSYLFILHSFIQFPGFFMVFIFVFQGLQRSDLQLFVNIMHMAIFDLTTKYVCIYVFRMIFAGIPQFGDAFGAMVGYAVGQLMGEIFTFLVSMKIYKNLGFHLGTIFRIDFGKEEFREVIRFGWKFVIGAFLVPLIHMVQAFLLSIWIFNYNAEWGYYSMVVMFTQIGAVVNLYSQATMSSMSESYSHDKKKLTELNIIQGLKVSYYISFFINAILFVSLDIFIIGAMGANWASAVKYIPFLMFRALWEPITWMGDKIFQGTGHTKEMSVSWVIEQLSRLILLLLFMNPNIEPLYLGMYGMLLALTVSLILKIIYQLYAIRKNIIAFRVYWWKMFLANFCAALVTMVGVYGIKKIFENTMGITAISGILTFAIAILGFFPIYSFLSGWFGAWDENTIQEFDRASAMVGVQVRFLARMLYKTTAYGSKHSLMGLHNKYVIDIYEDAVQEAKDLTAEKKMIVL